MSDRLQGVKLVNDCYSEWQSVSAGVTRDAVRPMAFYNYTCMINDLLAPSSSGLYKYVDDTTAYENNKKGTASDALCMVDEISL